MNFEARARGIQLLVKESMLPEDVAKRLQEGDRASALWHVASLVLTAEQISRIERTTELLLARGYACDGQVWNSMEPEQ